MVLREETAECPNGHYVSSVRSGSNCPSFRISEMKYLTNGPTSHAAINYPSATMMCSVG